MERDRAVRLLRVEEAAEYLNVKPSTIRAWLLRRKLPRVRVGERAVRIPVDALDRLIRENTIPCPRGAAMKLTCEQVARAVLGEPAKRQGRELLWLCPCHDDRHPSLCVNAGKELLAVRSLWQER